MVFSKGQKYEECMLFEVLRIPKSIASSKAIQTYCFCCSEPGCLENSEPSSNFLDKISIVFLTISNTGKIYDVETKMNIKQVYDAGLETN